MRIIFSIMVFFSALIMGDEVKVPAGVAGNDAAAHRPMTGFEKYMVNAFCLQVSLLVGEFAPEGVTREEYAVIRGLLRECANHGSENRKLAMMAILQNLDRAYKNEGNILEIVDEINKHYELLSPSVTIVKSPK